MDINNYSYTPHMLENGDTLTEYQNDDMCAEITKTRSYSNYLYYVTAYSFGPGLDFSESYQDEKTARRVYRYILDHYTTEPPTGDIYAEIDAFLTHPQTESEKRAETARRLFDFDVYGARDADETPETIAETIERDPVAIINYLLDYIEETEG